MLRRPPPPSRRLCMTVWFKSVSVLMLAAVIVAGCKTTPVREDEYNDPRYRGPGSGGAFGSEGLVLFGSRSSRSGSAEQGTGLGVNAYLWRAALDTLSFMPLAS